MTREIARKEPNGGIGRRLGVWVRRFRALRFAVRLTLVLLALFVLAAVFAPVVAPHNPYQTNLLVRNRPPSATYLLGTDPIGRDVLSRSIYALRTSVGIALIGVLSGTLIGLTMGIWAGLVGGWADRIISAVIDFFYAVPGLLLILVGISVFGTRTWVLIALISVARWHGTARLVRGQVFAIRELVSVEAAVALGASKSHVALRHVLPNLVSIIMVGMTLSFPGLLLLESSLSFVGLGVQPPLASLGAMVGEGRDYLMTAPWITLAPTGMIVTITLCFQVIGDWLRDAADVRQEAR